jgi:hypothetical protein
MALSEALGRPRPAARTPLEFLPVLGGLFPSLEGDLAVITHAYLKVRYGELPETHQEIEAVESAWARVRAQAQEQLGKKKSR